MLKKNPQTLEEAGIKDGQTILVELVEKVGNGLGTSKAKRSAKEEPKVQLYFTVRVGQGFESAKASNSSADDVKMRDDLEEEKKSAAQLQAEEEEEKHTAGFGKSIKLSLEVTKSQKLKQVKKNIQDKLGIQDKITLKLYLDGEEVTDDRLSVEDANLLV